MCERPEARLHETCKAGGKASAFVQPIHNHEWRPVPREEPHC